jgi:hypothetical protein
MSHHQSKRLYPQTVHPHPPSSQFIHKTETYGQNHRQPLNAITVAHGISIWQSKLCTLELEIPISLAHRFEDFFGDSVNTIIEVLSLTDVRSV